MHFNGKVGDILFLSIKLLIQYHKIRAANLPARWILITHMKNIIPIINAQTLSLVLRCKDR